MATVIGLRDYVVKNNFPGVILGLSGGIDSALCAAIAVDALGPEKIQCFMMPSKFTSRESIVDAKECAKNLKIDIDSIDIEDTFSSLEEALSGVLRELVNGIKDALENTPPELSADLVDMGLTLTGGGALLKNIDKRFSKETGLPVHIADDPLACVAIGTGKALEQEETFNTMLSEY